MKILFNNETQEFRKQLFVSIMPQGFEDVTSLVKNDLELEDKYLELTYVPEVSGVSYAPEYWTNGVDSVFNMNNIPTIEGENEEAVLDPSWIKIKAVKEVASIPAYYIFKKTATADQELRGLKMEKLNLLRQPLLNEADVEINKLEDKGESTLQWRTYRQALRDITEPFKKTNGEWKVLVDSLIIEQFEFPQKP